MTESQEGVVITAVQHQAFAVHQSNLMSPASPADTVGWPKAVLNSLIWVDSQAAQCAVLLRSETLSIMQSLSTTQMALDACRLQLDHLYQHNMKQRKDRVEAPVSVDQMQCAIRKHTVHLQKMYSSTVMVFSTLCRVAAVHMHMQMGTPFAAAIPDHCSTAFCTC